MYGEIVFYTHGSTIEYGGEIFAAGELTADILNFTPQDYRPIQRLLARMKELARQYEATLERGIWWELNNHLIELRSQLMRYRVFQILLKEDDQFLNETQQYTESYSLFTDEEMDEKDCTLERCLDLYQKEEEEHRTPLFLLIVPGGREDKWRYYKLQMARYQRYIDDVIVFNPTIHNFINFLLSKLKRNSPEAYAAALYQLYNDERLVEKLIANPIGPDRPFYQKYDHCVVSYERLTTNRLSGSAEDAVIRALTMKCLREEFMRLSKRDQEILGRYFGVYGFPKSDLREIAMRNRMKEPGVEKAKEQALKHLQNRFQGSFARKLQRAKHLVLDAVAERSSSMQ